MEEPPYKKFMGDRHQGTLTEGYITMLQIREVTGMGQQLNQGWLSVTTIKRKAILLDRAHKPKRHKNSAWFKEKMLLTEALESRAYLDPEQLAFLADNEDTLRQFSWPIYPPMTQMFSQSQVAKCNKVQQENLIVYETLTTELERFKEQVIVDRNAKVADFEKQIHSLKLQLNAIVESHKTLSTTVECLKKESKQKEDKYLDEVINLQNKKKALEYVVYKMGQSTQTMHMLTKPQAFYDENHKTALGYQNPFYLSQARRKVHALYDGNTFVKTHVALFVTNTEETLELAEDGRLKMLAKQNDPSLKEKKVNIAPVDYVALNKLSGHFVKHFMPKKQLSAEQVFWLPISQPISVKPPVPSEPVLKKEIPRELPSINKKYFEIEKKELSLDNDRLLEHIICQDVMNNVMHANDHFDNVLPANNNSLEHDNSALELLKHENDRLIELLISQNLVHTAVNSLATINDYKSMKQSFLDEY
ncbi:hypothetical protein Tco_0546099 [Tanacetum coccineum]